MTELQGMSTCPDCGKVRYLDRHRAKAAIRTMRGREAGGRLHAYRCGDYWHIGHMPTRVRNGDIDKAAWLATRKGNA